MKRGFFQDIKHLLTFMAVASVIIAVRFMIYMPEGIRDRIGQQLPF